MPKNAFLGNSLTDFWRNGQQSAMKVTIHNINVVIVLRSSLQCCGLLNPLGLQVVVHRF